MSLLPKFIPSPERERWFNEHVPYRIKMLRGLDAFVATDGRTGPLEPVFPSMFESALIACRWSGNFLGLCVSKKGVLCSIEKRHHSGDVFSIDLGGTLVDPDSLTKSDAALLRRVLLGAIKLPKAPICPTMPLTSEQWLDLLTACDKFLATAPVEGRLNAWRLKSLLVLIRYSGMRVSDAVTLTTDRLDGKRLFLYTQKTGVPVYTVLPDSVLRVLEATPRVTDTRYFWSGQGKRQTAVGDWQAKIKKVFDLAGISKGLGNAVSHRLRDTFAVELLLAGVPIERVSVLLGHQSVRVTEKHYNPWVRSRQEQLEADVASAWKLDPVLNDKNFGTNRVHSAKGPIN